MSKTKHTPVLWIAEGLTVITAPLPYEGPVVRYRGQLVQTEIAACYCDDENSEDEAIGGINRLKRQPGWSEAHANAKLIAAAPELLAALLALLNWGRANLSPLHNPDAHPLLLAAHDAVAKAGVDILHE